MSSSSEVRASLIEEATAGTTPATPAMLGLPITSQNMRDLVSYLESQQITSSRDLCAPSRVSRSSAGSLGCEFAYASPGEALYEAILGAMHADVADSTTTFTGATFNATNRTLTPATGQNFGDVTGTDGTIEPGDLIRINDGANPGYYVIDTITLTGNDITGATVQGTGTGADETVTFVRGERIVNGTTNRHYSIEISRLDIGLHHLFRKQVFDTMAINIATEQITNINFTTVGGLSVPSSTEIGASYATVGECQPVMDSVSVPIILVGGNEYDVTSVTVNANNGARARTRVGTDSVGRIARSRFRVNGSISMYKSSNVELLKYINGQSSSFAAVQEDSLGRAWAYSTPTVTYTRNETPTTNPDGDEIETMDYTSSRASNRAYTLKLQRFPAA